MPHPDWFDVAVGSNLFGDILSDLGPAVAGSIGIAAGGNINPERKFPSMFEPVHGSAPDIAGKFICNPIGQIWSAALMLEHLGEAEAAKTIVDAIKTLLRESSPKTRDMGGQAGTADVGMTIAEPVAAGQVRLSPSCMGQSIVALQESLPSYIMIDRGSVSAAGSTKAGLLRSPKIFEEGNGQW